MQRENSSEEDHEPSLGEELGIGPLSPPDEFLAPGDGGETVDGALVRGYYEQALSPGDDERVEYLIVHFRDWHNASREWLFGHEEEPR